MAAQELPPPPIAHIHSGTASLRACVNFDERKTAAFRRKQFQYFEDLEETASDPSFSGHLFAKKHFASLKANVAAHYAKMVSSLGRPCAFQSNGWADTFGCKLVFFDGVIHHENREVETETFFFMLWRLFKELAVAGQMGFDDRAEGYDPKQHKWPLEALNVYLKEQGEDVEALWGRIFNLINLSPFSVDHIIKSREPTSSVPTGPPSACT
uniref:Uncharacterized protein n=1 Tax=Chromera velia CCMP2878 TaxID=1169474 RepID=A0A0G4GWA1_9ALVE|eukprot:Cvel_5300.t1-p1 / transcript=Cvel_5300.t1 / gene=Cvel_5300 / organism=Chromera_velia_CCMP2878 / gene_product=hypothetical protein / transcript_product=hypothetical protein / location=Cvel_scaffold245:64300-71020(+) / protein_length=210 / sequence_SO=supercontig / SO=protein_coding / is_pseudo=false